MCRVMCGEARVHFFSFVVVLNSIIIVSPGLRVSCLSNSELQQLKRLQRSGADTLEQGREEKGKECGSEVQKCSVLEKLLKSPETEKSRRKNRKTNL